MIAIVKTGGKQYTVQENKTIKVEKLMGKVGDTVTFEDVLMVADASGTPITLGDPTIKGAVVTGEVIKQDRHKKVTVVKYKSKTRYKRTLGHRQNYTEVKITAIKG